MPSNSNFLGYRVQRSETGEVVGGITTLDQADLPPGDVVIRVEWSSLNYKDALAAQGHPGVAKRLPHVPGIDAAGTILSSASSKFAAGQPVLVTGYELGAGQWGGWSQRIRVPADWVVPLPSTLTAREAMSLGTAGFTAALCLEHLQRNRVAPQNGPVVVTGATGGVGCLAVALLSRLGYAVTASTGKATAAAWLKQLGAQHVVSREDVVNSADKPLASERWAGAIDTVGGATLASLLRSTRQHGCVAACGLVGGADLPLTAYPFILRGVVLAGATSQNCPHADRLAIWRKLAAEWRVEKLPSLTTEISLPEVTGAIAKILAGKIQGRMVVRVADA